MPKNITIDLRLWNTSGIGKYLQNIIPIVVREFKDINFTLLGNKNLLKSIKEKNYLNIFQLMNLDSY